jgi:16S rRNA (cytosine1402-N4)-methyltransferase
MALRMAVNQELDELEAMLAAAPARVSPGGRIVAISFHSLEDRLVKHAFQKLAREGRAALLTKKVVRPEPEELSRNAASRSAKLRSVEMSPGEPSRRQ